MLERELKRHKRSQRIKTRIFGTAKMPRLCIFRSGKHIYAQLVNDEKSEVIASANDLGIKKNKESKAKKTKKDKNSPLVFAREVGKLIAQKAKKSKIERVVFDRKGYKYHGRVKALADGAREEGLKF